MGIQPWCTICGSLKLVDTFSGLSTSGEGFWAPAPRRTRETVVLAPSPPETRGECVPKIRTRALQISKGVRLCLCGFSLLVHSDDSGLLLLVMLFVEERQQDVQILVGALVLLDGVRPTLESKSTRSGYLVGGKKQSSYPKS